MIQLLKKIRGNAKFENEAALIEQMRKDVAEINTFLQTLSQ